MALADVIVNAAEVPASQIDFMVEVKQADLPASFLLNNGDDIRAFRNGGTTQVPCHAAGFSSGAGKLFIFLTGLLSAIDDTPIRISADGTSPAPPVDSTYGRNAVWPTHVTANHLYGDGTDYSGNGNDLVASVSGTVVFNADHVAISAGGWLETAANLSGADFTDGYAIQFLWDNPVSQAFAARQLSASAGGTSGLQLSENLLIRHNTNNQTVSTAGLYGGGLKGIDVTWENATNGLATYVAGAPEGTGNSMQTPNAGGANSVPLYVYSHGDSFRALEGDLYSFRWDTRPHDAPWVATEDSNRNSATFYTVTEIPEGIAPDDVVQAQTLDTVTLTAAGVTVAPDDVVQAQALDEPVLTQVHALPVDPLVQLQALDEPVLTQAHVVVVADATQAQALDEPLLTVEGFLTPDRATQAQALDEPDLLQRHVLAVAGLLQPQLLENVTLDTSGLTINAEPVAQIQGLDEPALTQYHVLAVDDLTQAQILEVVNLGGLVVGSLDGELVVYVKLAGTVRAVPALSGKIN